jgi:PKD repeat protein
MKEMRGKIKVIMCCILLVTALAASFLKVQCVPLWPHRFYGYVTVAGAPAPDGTLVAAKIAGITYASTTTVDGKYGYAVAFNVPADDPDTPEKEGGQEGDTIEFYVAGRYATSYTFEYGAITQLNLTIAAPAPYADFTANVTTGYEPLTVEFTDQSKNFDSIESYTWDFGDGNVTVTSSPKIVHTYIQNGTYTVSLTVNGTAAGEVFVDTMVKANFITVYDTKPIANFYAEPTSGLRPLTVAFYDNSTSYDRIAAWEWDFGDGFTSNEQNPTHTYTKAGTYTVKLKVTETDGDINICTKENYITVGEVTPPTITINNPTTTNPTYTRSEAAIQVTYTYTEASPKNATIKVYNSTHTVATATVTGLAGGTNIQRIDNIKIPAGTAEGSYNLNVTIYNIYELSATATQLGAIIVDNTKPVITIIYPTEGSYISVKKVWINGTITEANIGDLKPSINDTRFTLQEWNSATGKFAFLNNTAIPDGKITLTVSFTDLAQNTASATISFTQDTTAPTITGVSQNPPRENVQPTDTVEVTATVTDAVAGIKNVTLHYSTDGGATWTTVPMEPTEQAYKGTIPAFPYNTVVQYYIEAFDKAGNKRVSPEAEYYIYTVIPEFPSTIVILLTLLAAISIAAAIKWRKGFSTNPNSPFSL